MMQKDESRDASIRRWPAGMFWSRDNELTQEQAVHQSERLRDMPVHGTGYLLDEGETFLMSVPYRHRN